MNQDNRHMFDSILIDRYINPMEQLSTPAVSVACCCALDRPWV
jgi:phage gp36-like protein